MRDEGWWGCFALVHTQHTTHTREQTTITKTNTKAFFDADGDGVIWPRDTYAGFRADGAWTTPPGTVWMKHFELELTNGVPESRKRLETRFLVRMSNGVYGVTYRWNSPTNAVLVPDAGAD